MASAKLPFKRFLYGIVLCVISMRVGTPAARSARAGVDPALQAALAAKPYDDFYGVYVKGQTVGQTVDQKVDQTVGQTVGQKVGWMRARLKRAALITLSTELHAEIKAMGQVSAVELMQERIYHAKTGVLERLRFVQKASTGQVQVEGERQGSSMRLNITAGGLTRTHVLPNPESLSDALAVYRLARQARVGRTAEGVILDAAMQKVCQVKHRVEAVEKRMLAGVESPVVKVISRYPDLDIEEITYSDGSGRVLEAQIGAMFTARLEPPDVARRLDYQQDLLIGAVVPVPYEIAHPQKLSGLSVILKGLGSFQPPQTPRQHVHQDNDVWRLSLSQDAPPGPQALPKRPSTSGALRQAPSTEISEIQEALKPTAFIQSDAPEIIETAQKAAQGATDVWTASVRLNGYVYRLLKSEYVPAYSNALEALHSKRGDCTEHSVLFVALARALGIPARVAVGLAYWPPGKGFGWHAWTEIHTQGRWIAMDPTWNQSIADATHLKLAEGSPAQQARIVMLLGQLRIVGMTLHERKL